MNREYRYQLSCIVPIYNVEEYLEECLESSKMALYGHYKFVIAFENSCVEDYVTEKFFDPLLVGAVPIYFGAPNIDELVPRDNCYVDVRKYKTADALAVHFIFIMNMIYRLRSEMIFRNI